MTFDKSILGSLPPSFLLLCIVRKNHSTHFCPFAF